MVPEKPGLPFNCYILIVFATRFTTNDILTKREHTQRMIAFWKLNMDVTMRKCHLIFFARTDTSNDHK